MKINGKILALCVFHPNFWATSAFLAPQAPKVAQTPAFSYLGSINGMNGDVAQQTAPESPSVASPSSISPSRTVRILESFFSEQPELHHSVSDQRSHRTTPLLLSSQPDRKTWNPASPPSKTNQAQVPRRSELVGVTISRTLRTRPPQSLSKEDLSRRGRSHPPLFNVFRLS